MVEGPLRAEVKRRARRGAAPRGAALPRDRARARRSTRARSSGGHPAPGFDLNLNTGERLWTSASDFERRRDRGLLVRDRPRDRAPAREAGARPAGRPSSSRRSRASCSRSAAGRVGPLAPRLRRAAGQNVVLDTARALHFADTGVWSRAGRFATGARNRLDRCSGSCKADGKAKRQAKKAKKPAIPAALTAEAREDAAARCRRERPAQHRSAARVTARRRFATRAASGRRPGLAPRSRGEYGRVVARERDDLEPAETVAAPEAAPAPSRQPPALPVRGAARGR